MDVERERERFEPWAESKGMSLDPLRGPNGRPVLLADWQYHSEVTQMAFWGWLARARLAEEDRLDLFAYATELDGSTDCHCAACDEYALVTMEGDEIIVPIKHKPDCPYAQRGEGEG